MIYQTPLGMLHISDDGTRVLHARWLSAGNELHDGGDANALNRHIRDWLDDYFAARKTASLSPSLFAFDGVTPFTEAVLQQVLRVPHGSLASYKELAQMLSTGARAVGGALRRNPFAVLIPCHRIVPHRHKEGAIHELGGYMGKRGLNKKRALLDLEKA